MKTRLFKSSFLTSLILTLLLTGLTMAHAQRENIDMHDRFQINKDASFVTFETSFAGIPAIRGSFSGYQGNIFYNPEHEDRTSATIRFDATTISTAHPKRDNVLQSPAFLDIKNFPGMWFQSTSVAVKSSGMELTGNLYIRDKVSEVVLHLDKPKVMRKAMNNNDLMIATGKLSISRKAFGLGVNVNIPAVKDLGDKIDVEFSLACTNYTIDYLKNTFVGNDANGKPKVVGLIYEEVKAKGYAAGEKKLESLTKQADYQQTNWLGVLANLGWILMVDGYGKEAVRFFELALKQDPNHFVSNIRFGDALVIAGDYERALDHYNKEYSLPSRVRFTHLPEMIKQLNGKFDLKNMK